MPKEGLPKAIQHNIKVSLPRASPLQSLQQLIEGLRLIDDEESALLWELHVQAARPRICTVASHL